MLKDILYKIERLEDFVSSCQNSGDLSLIDKDVILQSLRDIYKEVGSMPIADDDFFDSGDSDDTNTVVFEQKDLIVESKVVVDDDVPSVAPEVDLNISVGSVSPVIDEDVVVVTYEELEDSEPEEPKQEEDICDLAKKISDSDKVLILEELCGNDDQQYQEIIAKLDQMEDFDTAMIYLHDKFEDKLNNSAVALLADVLAYKITE